VSAARLPVRQQVRQDEGDHRHQPGGDGQRPQREPRGHHRDREQDEGHPAGPLSDQHHQVVLALQQVQPLAGEQRLTDPVSPSPA
jgi:hypothetical protein